MSESQADEKSEAEAARVLQRFKDQLDVDDEVATILVQEGFTGIEEVAYVPESEMLAIEEFEEDIVRELQSRARDVLLAREIAKEEGLPTGEPEEDLLALEGMDRELAETLARHGVVSRENLAEQSVDEVVEATGIDPQRAGQLIMAARAIWFENEDQA